MKRLPKARTVEIVERDLEDELLVYDLTTHIACTLNKTSKTIYKACGERQTFDELKEKHRLTDELVYFALDQLNKQNLLADDSYVSPFAGMNRREVIKKVGLASMIALPVISSLTAPPASRAASGGNLARCQPCVQNSDCASGRCLPGLQSSGRFCSNGSAPSTLRPNERLVGIGEIICPSVGTEICCSGSATFSAPSSCTCNAV